MTIEAADRTSFMLIDGRQSDTSAAVAQGVRRMLWSLGIATVCEFVLANGRRADIAGVAADGSIHIVEIKSSVQDFRCDNKWPEYLEYCDFYYFAAPVDLDSTMFPADTGFIVADSYGAEIVRTADKRPMNAARRRALLVRFSQQAANRQHSLQDANQ
jgi:hypothetical protein